MMKLDELLSMNGEAQAVEAPFDGANGEAASSADVLDEMIKGLDEKLSNIIRDLEDQVEQLEGDAATAATTATTKDAKEKMQKKIAKLDGELIEAEITRRSDLDDMTAATSRQADATESEATTEVRQWKLRVIITETEVRRLKRELSSIIKDWEEERIEVQQEQQAYMATAESRIEDLLETTTQLMESMTAEVEQGITEYRRKVRN